MYCDYFGFREKPFNITPDPGFMFLSAHHNEAFAHLLYGIDNHVGFIALTGEVGAGKTTVIRTLLGQLSPDRYRTAIIFNPCLSSHGLMQSINREYGLPGDHPDTADLLTDLNRFLLEENAAGRTVVLVVDEAQNLAPAVLEQVRLISNLETERDKLIQIVLVGQPELRDLLERPELRQLGQRIGVSYHLLPMSLADTRDYIAHRMEVAGRREPGLFTTAAVTQIYRFSGGLPRLINLACDRALLLGYTREKTPITCGMARTAIADVRIGERGGGRPYRTLAAGIGLLIMALFGAGLYGLPRAPAPQPTKEAPSQIVTRQAPSAAEPFLAAATRELALVKETDNGLAAFNALARIWGVAPATWASPQPDLPAVLARERGFDTIRFTGNLGSLLRLDAPAILELDLAGVNGRRYLALTGAGDNRYTVAPPLAGRATLSGAELDRIWSGRATIPWMNRCDIPPGLKLGAQGPAIRRLQELLRGTGFYRGAVDGTFDRHTRDAVLAFQASKGVEPDGTVGPRTLFFLCRASGENPVPALAGSGGGP